MVFCKQVKALVVLVFMACLWWSSCIQVKAANHSLRQGETLNATGGKLCSEKGKYCMSFIQLPSGQTPTYLAIYGVKEKDDWAAWVANKKQPVDIDSAVLSLNHSGVLKIEYKDGEPIILYSSPQPENNTVVATLLDTGNFVLQQLHPNGSTRSLLWQSFDTPGDTFLPGMKLGVDHKTGHNLSLASWLANNNPAPGAFSLEWDRKRRELIIRRKGQICWTTGELRNKKFKYISGESNYKVVSNENEDYFTLESSTDGLTKWTLLDTGQLMNKDQGNDIARADMCYGYNTDGGCQKWEDIPSCRDPGDVFVAKQGYFNLKLVTHEANSSYGPSDCKIICWSNCSCFGFQEFNVDGTGCTFLWNSTEGTSLADSGSKFYILMKNNHHKRIKNWIWISAAIAIVLLLIWTTILCLVLKKRKYPPLKEKKRRGIETEMLDLADLNRCNLDLANGFKKGQYCIVFNYTSIVVATNDFSSVNKLGQGGFGPVYKGTLPTGKEVAVKRLSETSAQGIVEFKNELSFISELQHTNLVQLLGYCIHEDERMLIYEYMPNKSLDFFLFDCTRSMLLDWRKRFNIVEGISQGLLYLHKYSRLKIIHRDLKASNILLDENMNPKISDFGMARMFTQHKASTNRIVGTYGYMSPEYAMAGVFSIKSDVYSFGVLMLEIVSGRRNTSFYNDESTLNLVGHAWKLWNEGASLQLMNPSLSDSFVADEVQRCIHVGLLCVEECADDRPTMSDIISMLTNKSAALTFPRKPAFCLGRKISEENSTCKQSYNSSQVEPR